MTHSPRFLLSIAIASVFSTPIIQGAFAAEEPAAGGGAAAPAAATGGAAAPAPASATAAAPAPAPAPVNPDLRRAADDFFHYASVGRFELAKAAGDQIISMNAPPAEVMAAFQASVEDRNRRVPPERRVELYERMLSWQRVDAT